MWFVWIGNIISSLISYLFSKSSFKNFKLLVVIPLSVVYIGMMVTSFGLFAYAVMKIVNTIFDLINEINETNFNSTTNVFRCFYYLLDALGVADSLEVGISLIVSNLLAILVLQATMAGKNQVQSIIKLFKDL